ncbi:MAG: TraB/GumN family protein [Rudaea sp.]|nr:TraB/GumN family protein [Rudaea sp.]
MRLFAFVACLLGCVANAQVPTESPAMPTLDTVLVTGEQPGPGLWKVSRSDHVLWILGTQTPLPRKMRWRAQEVEATIAQSQEVLADASAKVDIGFFRALTLLPSIMGARKNEEGGKLRDILPADLYTRWSALKAKYIGRDNGVERLRPMFAARELYEKAIDKSGLSGRNEVWRMVEKAARKNRVPIQTPEVKIPLDDPKQAIRDFKSTTGELDVACLAATITRLETDLDAMRQRANAWAIGDLDALKNLPYPDQRVVCLAAVSSNPNLREHIDEARARIDATWLAAAEKALAENRSTFAVLPIAELVKSDGRLAALQARGYAIQAPE